MRAILLAGGLSLIFTLLGTRVAIRVLVAKGYGQLIRDDGPTTHHTKRGTPTMGGLVIIISVVLAYFVRQADHPGRAVLVGAAAAVPVRRARASSASSTTTSRSPSSAASACAARPRWPARPSSRWSSRSLALTCPDDRGQTPASPAISFIRDFDGWALPGRRGRAADPGDDRRRQQRGEPHRRPRRPGHRRLDDGVRRLHAGQHLAEQPVVRAQPRAHKCYEVRDPLDLAVVAAALTGACFGFLWWNASPAKIFMGDTGSLSLGGALAGLAILTRTEFLLAILGGLFVDHHDVGDPAGRLLQAHRGQTDLPDGAAAAPLRAQGLGRDHRRDPVLDHHRPLRRRRARASSTPSGSPGVHRAPEAPAGRRLGRRSDSWAGVRAVVVGHRRLRLRRRRQPAAPRRHVTVLGRVGQRRAAGEGRRCSRCSAPTVRLGAGATATLPDDVDLVVTSPGLAADRAAARRRRPSAASRSGARSSWPGGCATPSTPAPWLCVTGTNGKTTTVQMLDAILRAAGLRSVACGNVGLPIVEAVMDPEPYDVLRRRAVQLPAALHVARCRAHVRRGAQRRRGPPRLVHGPTDGRLRRRQGPDLRAACSAPASTTSPTRSPSSWSARPTSSRAPAPSASPSARPAVGMVGLVDDVLADRAFVEERRAPAPPSCATVADLASPAPHFVANALAAAALARVARRAAGRGPRRAAGLPARRAPHRRGRPTVGERALRRRLQGHQPARRRSPRCRPTTPSSGSPAGWPRARRFDDLVAARARPAARASCCSAGTAR